MDLEHTTDLLRPSPAWTLPTSLASWVLPAHMCHLAAMGGMQYTPNLLIRDARPHGRCDGVVLPARRAGAQCPIRKAGSSSEDLLRCEGGEAEIQASDRQGQR